MAISTRTMRIVGATLIAVVLVGGAYLLSGPNPFNSVNAASTEELLRAYAAKDTDNDGLPDWEEGLYGTDPANARSVQADLTDRQAVDKGLVKPKFSSAQPIDPNNTTLADAPAFSGTLTDRFAQQLLSNYLNTRGTERPSNTDIAAYTQKAVDDLIGTGLPARYTQANLKVQGAGPEALRAYAVAAERAFAAHTTQTTKDELAYYNDYLQKGDKAALAKVKALSNTYTNTSKALLAVPVPTEAAYGHLELVNAMANMGEVLGDMAEVSKDPLTAYVGIASYPKAYTELLRGFSDLDKVFTAEQVVISEDTPGFFFYRAMDLMAQAAAQTK